MNEMNPLQISHKNGEQENEGQNQKKNARVHVAADRPTQTRAGEKA